MSSIYIYKKEKKNEKQLISFVRSSKMSRPNKTTSKLLKNRIVLVGFAHVIKEDKKERARVNSVLTF